MERLAVILAMFVLLMNGRHVEHRLPQKPMVIAVSATALALPSPSAQGALGRLRWLGGWVLASDSPAFGGLSSMRADPGTGLQTLSDTGDLIRLPPIRTGRLSAIQEPLPTLPGEERRPRWEWDTESQATDPATGQSWVGFELGNRICRYAAGFQRVEHCAYPPAMKAWPKSTGMESLQRLNDGRFIAIAEEADGPVGPHDTLLFAGDPVDPATPPPQRLSYHAPEGYLPSDLLSLGGGRFLVLNRRVTLTDGFTAVLTLASIDIRRKVLAGPVVARLESPLPHDNWEALALSREGARPVLWVASDDNHLFFQRTLLLKLALPPEWMAAGANLPP